MKHIAILISVVTLCFSPALAQQSIKIKPGSEKGKDVVLHGLNSEQNRNYGTTNQFASGTWSFGGQNGTLRSLMYFDLIQVPPNVVIDSAILSLYAWNNGSGFGPHSSLSGENTSVIERVLSPWNEETATWNNQPETDDSKQIVIPPTNDPAEDYQIDVSGLIRNLLDSATPNYGFMIKGETEEFYRMMNFASSDHENSTLHPELDIYYSTLSSVNENRSPKARINMYPNPSSGKVNLQLSSQTQKSSLSIVNIAGMEIFFKTIDANQATKLHVDLPEGMYFVQWMDENKKILATQKLSIY